MNKLQTIIEELDKEGINLQETRLNLINQGYESYWDFEIRSIFYQVMFDQSQKFFKEMMNEMENPTAEELINDR